MEKQKDNSDQIVIKQKKGTWIRFIKLFPQCRLPWIWLIVYIALSFGTVNLGISETDYTAQLFSGDTSSATVTKLIVIMIINLAATNIVVFIGQITSAKINRNMRGIVLKKVMRLPMSFFKDEQPREAIYRIVDNAIVIDSTVMVVIIPLITAAYTVASVFGKVFTYDWRLSVILLAFIPVHIFIAFIFGRMNYSLSERDTAINASLTERLAELVTNIPLAKAFAKEDKEVKNGEELTARLYRINIRTSWVSQFKDLSETLVSLIQALIIVFVGIALLGSEAIPKRSWIAFFLFSAVFDGAITQIMMYWNNLKIIQGGAERVAEIMNAPEEDRDGAPCENLSGDIEIRDLHFGYDEDKNVFEGVSCTFKDHTTTALLGVSGCGKTTLINLIIRLYKPQNGEIEINEKSIFDYALDDYRNQFVTVSQTSMLFSGTIRENICYGNEQVSDQEVVAALKKAGAYDFVMDMPNGPDSLLEEYGSNLSGGQRQRLAVARALLSKAHYIILDEPVASMDAIATAELMDILQDISKGRCMIIIAHSPQILSIAQRAVVIENGAVSAEGELNSIRRSSTFLQEFMGKEAECGE